MSSPPDISPSNSSASPPTSDSSPPPSTPPPTSNSTSPTPVSSSPPPDSPPPDSSPPPQIPDPPLSSTPPPSTSEPPPPPPPPNETPPPSSPPPSIPPPVTPSTPNAPPPRNVSPPPPSIPPPVTPSTPNPPPPRNVSPPPGNPPTRPSASPPPPAVTPPSPTPPARTLPPPSPPTPPRQSPPAPKLPPPPTDLPPPPRNTTFPPPSVPTSSSPPPSPGNPTASEPPTPTNSTSTSSSTRGGGGLPAGGVIAIVLVVVLALSLVVFALCFIRRRKKKRPGPDSGHMAPPPILPSRNPDSFSVRTESAPKGSGHQSPYQSANLSGSDSTTKTAYNGDPGGSRSWFTYEELVKATNGFSEDNILGEGGFGYVYKGNLPDGREVAVKQLKIGSGQGEREFKAEVEIISRIHHRHLVSIVGYCISDSQRLLVYDYVPNNTLHYHLHGNASVMTWPTRFKVASGAARGIAYLHEDCIPRIIHRDIKSANILLDNNFEAKVADFGLAKLALELEAQTHVSTRVMGTFGYMAPEYATSGKLTDKSDVYSFGVVLLELITGRKPVDSSRSLGDESLVEWARPLLTQALENGSFQNLVDSRLENNYVKIEMFRLTEAAAACVRHSASKRPKMTQVLRALDSIGQMSDLTNGMKPGDSQIVDSREQSAEIRLFQRMAFGNQDYDSDLFSNSHSSWSG